MIALDRQVLLQTLDAAVNETMEAMFFDAAAPVREGECCAGADMVTVCLWFHDAVDGEFMLAAPLPTAMALASGFMGVDNEQVQRRDAEQIACELANIICGSALSRLEPSSELRLSSPMATPRACATGDDVIYQHYQLLDGCLSVSLRID
ncbi:MAG TPA: chemotaxis protein CheX [Bryobacteraceae bacterium]|nr:chemotaxis protein CheX [Bryobacteraceae bacterium]